MEKFVKTTGKILEWIQPKARQRKYELRSEGRLYSTLAFVKSFGSLARAATSEGTWTLKRVGFFSPRVTVREEGKETDVAVFTPGWTGTRGELRMSDGRVLQWKAANYWATQFVFLESTGLAVLSFKSGIEHGSISDVFKEQARIEIGTAEMEQRILSLLAVLGWYLIILQQEDTAATVTATTSSAV